MVVYQSDFFHTIVKGLKYSLSVKNTELLADEVRVVYIGEYMGMNKVSEDVMKRRNFISVVIVFIFSMTLLVGCGEWTQRFYSDKHLEKIAKKSLYEKYNEEFEVRNIYQQAWKDFYAVCSPTKDDSVVFEANLFKDGRIIYDRYLDEIIEDEIRDEVSKCLDDLWDDYYIDGSIFLIGVNAYNIDYSLDSYVDLTYELAKDDKDEDPYPHAAVVIYLPSSIYINSRPENEFAKFENEVQGLINKHIIPPITVNIYVVADNQLRYVKEYLENNTIEDSYFRDMRGDQMYRFSYDKNSGEILIDYEEYCKRRKEAIENE